MEATADMLQLSALSGASDYVLDAEKVKAADEDDEEVGPEKTSKKRKSTGGDSGTSSKAKARGTSKADANVWKKAVSAGVAAATVMEISMQGVPFVNESRPQCDVLRSVGCVLSWAWCAWQIKVCH